MEREPTSDSSVLRGIGVLALCAGILLAGYVAATMRPVGAAAVAAEIAPADS